MDVLIGAIVSVLTGVLLWAALPRGVILTRSMRTRTYTGEPLYDTWEVRNDSPLPVTIRAVTVASPATVNPKSGRIEQVELPAASNRDSELGVLLHFDDETLEATRLDMQRRWRGLQVPPGDTMQAHVSTNHTLTIKYRRRGLFGIFERRVLRIQGTV